MEMVARDNDVEPNNFGVHGVLKQALRVILLLRGPIPKPKRRYQLYAPLSNPSLSKPSLKACRKTATS
jgi:hypothetical protein